MNRNVVQAKAKLVTRLRDTATEIDVVYCLSNKHLGTYTVKAILQNCLILQPTCSFQQDLYIPSPCNDEVPTSFDEDPIARAWALTIAEYSLGGEPIDIYRLTFTWRE